MTPLSRGGTQLRVGSVVKLRSLQDYRNHGAVRLSYTAPRGELFVALLLACEPTAEAEKVDPNAVMIRAGWTPPKDSGVTTGELATVDSRAREQVEMLRSTVSALAGRLWTIHEEATSTRSWETVVEQSDLENLGPELGERLVAEAGERAGSEAGDSVLLDELLEAAEMVLRETSPGKRPGQFFTVSIVGVEALEAAYSRIRNALRQGAASEDPPSSSEPRS